VKILAVQCQKSNLTSVLLGPVFVRSIDGLSGERGRFHRPKQSLEIEVQRVVNEDPLCFRWTLNDPKEVTMLVKMIIVTTIMG
jgi:hypothetical protein